MTLIELGFALFGFLVGLIISYVYIGPSNFIKGYERGYKEGALDATEEINDDIFWDIDL